MRWSRIGAGAIVASGLMLTGARDASAEPTLRVQVSQHGDFVLFGNTLGRECFGNPPAPIVGDVGDCGGAMDDLDDTSPDVFWRSDSPADGQAEANATISPDMARSTAVLDLPDGASVTHAYLYWAATLAAPGTDPQVTVERPGTFMTDVDAGEPCYQSTNNSYHCFADLTQLVQDNGEGPYRLSGIDARSFVGEELESIFAGWYMVVLYQLPADPLRNLAIFDGFDPVGNNAPQNAVLSGFLVPDSGISGKLGLATFEGDLTVTGDRFFFNGGQPLTDATNAANNFFNGSRSYLGAPVSVDGDLPQLTGGAGSMSGMDLDVVDVTGKLMSGQTMAPIVADSTGDVYYLAAFITSISDYRPDFTTSTKTAEDIDGGSLLPGDTIEYTITAINTGNDTAIDVVLTDPLPAGVTYVTDSLQVSMGPNMGAKTDDAGDDQGEYDMGTNTVIFRIGTGADEINGGVIPVGESTEVKFRVTVDPDTMGEIQNQGLISAAGEMGAPPSDTPTDGNGGDQGSPPTGSVVDLCSEDADCSDPTPFCNTDLDPNQCVGCVDDGDCGPLTPTCEQEGFTCVCIASGDEVCDGVDNDCNGEADEGFNVGDACSAGEGECAADGQIACNDDGEAACDATPGSPGVEVCDELDNDCDGDIDNACVACVEDADCGADDSGKVCDDGGMCIDGCRGTGGNGCPDGQECTSQDDSIGMCVPAGETDSGASNSDSDSTPTESNSDADSTPTESNSDADSDTESDSNSNSDGNTDSAGIDDEGFGCECGAQSDGSGGGWLLLGVAGLTLGTRRRRRAA